MNARILHRRLGAIFCLFVLIASGSGVVHNLMSWTQPPPPRPGPRGAVIPHGEVVLTPADAIRRLPDQFPEPTAVNLRVIAGAPWYALSAPGMKAPAYVHAVTGEFNPGMDEVFAREIAARFLGREDLRKTDYLNAFNREYIEIYRILPVHRFDVEDGQGTRVYVSTLTESVTRHTDRHRQLQATLFSLFHKFAFIPDKGVRNTVLTVTTGGIFLTALAGLILLLPRRKRG